MTPEDLLSALPIAAVLIGPDGRIAALNDAAAALLGADISGRHYVTALRQPALVEAVEAGFAGQRTEARWLQRNAGRDSTYQVSVAPLGRSGGSGSGLLASFVDMTPLEEAGERRSEFVANVSHELRTPLTAIAGFVETLRGPAHGDTQARARFLEIMAHEAGRMNRLVHDLLSLTRVEDTERLRPMDELDIAALIARVVEGLSPQAGARGVQLSVIGCEAPQMATGDIDQLTQVFTNLVENAIKYGRENGHVRVILSAEAREAVLGGPAFRIAVEDEGEGIDERHLGRLTERFYRVDTHRSRGMGGTGLGLAIVKHIVSRRRGWLRIESGKGQGSRFTVFLPAG